MSDNDEHGVALIIVMMTITLLTALGAAVTLATVTETAIAANYRDSAEALHAAEGAVEFVMQELAGVADWSGVIAESGRSAFVDGPAGGIRTVGAVTLDLTQATGDANAIATPTPGAASPPSVLFAFGRFRDLVAPGASRSQVYVAVWVADRSDMPGDATFVPDTLSVLGQAYGPRGSRRAIEAIVMKTDSSAVRVLHWREVN